MHAIAVDKMYLVLDTVYALVQRGASASLILSV